jgi:hypothetical protein
LEVAALTEKNCGALDFEPNTTGPTMTLADARDWLQNFDLVAGKKAKLYSGNLIKETLGANKDDFLAQHDLWLAQYGSHPVTPANWSAPWIWQYTDGARDYGANLPIHVAGITGGNLDCNAFAGSDVDLAATWVA